jgi:hypothetical protein
MSIFTKSIKAAFAVLAIGSATLAPIAAEASPRHHGGSHHGHHGWGGHHGGWGHGGGWRGGWSGGVYPIIYNGGAIRRCRIVERVDAYGDVIGTRRVCRGGY